MESLPQEFCSDQEELIDAFTSALFEERVSEEPQCLTPRSMMSRFEIVDPPCSPTPKASIVQKMSSMFKFTFESKSTEESLKVDQNMHNFLESPLTPEMIKSEGFRKVYYGVDLEFEEQRLMDRFKEHLYKNNLFEFIGEKPFEQDHLAIKCIHAEKLNFEKAFEKIRSIQLMEQRMLKHPQNKETTNQILVMNN